MQRKGFEFIAFFFCGLWLVVAKLPLIVILPMERAKKKFMEVKNLQENLTCHMKTKD